MMLSPTERNQPGYQQSTIQTPADVSGSVCQSVADIHIHKAYNAKSFNSPEGKPLIKRKVDRHLTPEKRARSGLLEPELKEAFFELAEYGKWLRVREQLNKYGLKPDNYHQEHRSCATNEEELLDWIKRQDFIDGTWFGSNSGLDKRCMTPAILSAATSKLSSNFHFFLSGVPDELKNDDFYRALLHNIQRKAKEIGSIYSLSLPSLSVFPEKYIDSEVASLFVNDMPSNLEYVSDPLKTEELCLKAFLKNSSTIAHVPKTMITDDFLQSSNRFDLDSLRHLPEEMITEDRLKKINHSLVKKFRNTDFSHCSGSDVFEKMLWCDEDFLRYFPSTVLQRFPNRLLNYIERKKNYIPFQGVSFPEPQKTLEKLVLIHNNYHRLVEDYKHDDTVNAGKIYALCFSCKNRNRFNMNNIPAHYHNNQLCHEIMNRFEHELLPLSTISFLMRFPEGKTFVRQKLNEYAMNGYQTLLALLQSESIPLDEKKALINRLDQCHLFSSYFHQKQYERLYSDESPLTYSIANPFLGGLKQTVYSSQFYFPLNPVSNEIQQYLANKLPRFFSEPNEKIKAILKNLENQSICGGRTFKGFYKGRCYYFKVQRRRESLATLAHEGLMHKLCHSRGEGVSLSLKSEVPEFVSWFQIKKSELPALHKHFTDRLEIDSSGNNPRVNVYCYRASPEYSHYAHTPIDKDDLETSLKRSDEGFLKAAWDIGKLCSVGLIPTSTLPAYHDTHSERRWFAIAALMHSGLDEGIPGCFGAWNTTATDKPDFGVTGLRDIGDTECYGSIHSYFVHPDVNKQLSPNAVNQRMAVCNAVMENLLAMVLIRARLRQHCKGYHYRNPDAMKDTMGFIQNTTEELLKGLFDKKSDSTLNLQAVLGTPDDHYQKWLERSAQEILYWTALQPDEEGFAELKVNGGDYDPDDCYSRHIDDTQRFCPELYPTMPEQHWLKYPEHFININNKLNLGAASRCFPLVSLMKGYTLLCDRVFSKDRPELLNNEPVASPIMTVVP